MTSSFALQSSSFLYRYQSPVSSLGAMVKLFAIICFSFLAIGNFGFVESVSRAFDGSDNNPDNPSAAKAGNYFLRNITELNFNKQNNTPINSLTDVTDYLSGRNITSVRCTDPVPSGLYPLPRCISNILCSYNLSDYDTQKKSSYRSFRSTSHFVTFFGEFVSFDLISSKASLPNYTYVYIPADDSSYNLNNTLGQTGKTFLPANRSDLNNGTNPLYSGYNLVTPFLDLNNIYGSSKDQQASLRENVMGKLKVSTVDESPYPPKNGGGAFVWGAVSTRSPSIFTLAIQTIWIREHNRMCEILYKQHPEWSDDDLFQEARRWNIAYYQKVVTEEYLGIILGHPLPAYQSYDKNIKPGIDTFFATVAFRYGHSELSDNYQIQNEIPEIVATVPFRQLNKTDLLTTFGVETVLRSMALQRQEEVDIFLASATKNVISSEPNTYDLAAFDIIRSRERGIPFYNVVRQSFGIPKANSFSDISSNPLVQSNLARVYSSVDQVEAWVGILSEDHLEGSNFGRTLSASFETQFSNVRDTDIFWWENPKSPTPFNDADKAILRNTTFRDIIMRNINSSVYFPQNIWTVQPQSKLSGDDSDYPNKIEAWPQYIIFYRIGGISSKTIDFKVMLQTSGGKGWFGMGFGPDDLGMQGADFYIGIIDGQNITLKNYHADPNIYHPPIVDKDQDQTVVVRKASLSNSGVATVEFTRSMDAARPGKKPIVHGTMKLIMAYNPTSSQFSYHGNNRILMYIDFYDNIISSAVITSMQLTTKAIHGACMFFVWCILFPTSVFWVRYFKHRNDHLTIHRFAQLFGGALVSTVGVAAITTVQYTQSPHAWLSLFIFSCSFVQLTLGLIAKWGQSAVVSVNKGYPRFVKRTHKFFGAILLLSAWYELFYIRPMYISVSRIFLAYWVIRTMSLAFCIYKFYLLQGIDIFCSTYDYDSTPYKAAYICWLVMIVSIFAFGEFWWIRQGTLKKLICMDENESSIEKRSMIHTYINHKEYLNLPEITWDEFNERVQSGAYFVVCDNLVVNVRKWIGAHPGGSKILERVIGTDITRDFFNIHKKDVINEEVILSETPLSSNEKPLGSIATSVLEKYTSHLTRTFPKQKKSTIAEFIDRMNVKYYLSVPLATHTHSRFATRKLASLVVGRIKESEKTSIKINPIHKTESLNTNSKDGLMAEDMVSHKKFSRYKLTSKSPVNASTKYPVMRFTFTKVHQVKIQDKNANDSRFLPGHYIEIQARVKGQVVVRSYIPLEGTMSKSFSIYVKIYPHGLISQHLNKQLIGYEVRVRGPFDVMEKQMRVTLKTNGYVGLPIPGSPYLGPDKDGFSGKTSLLNPSSSDGCWETLYMIAGGTGITPMLQLIRYHLEQVLKRGKGSRVQMNLLLGNREVEDIIDAQLLEELAFSSRGMLTVKYCLSKPPSAWGGFHGIIGDEILREWINSLRDESIQSPVQDRQGSPISDLTTETMRNVTRSLSPFPTESSYYENNYYSESNSNWEGHTSGYSRPQNALSGGSTLSVSLQTATPSPPPGNYTSLNSEIEEGTLVVNDQKLLCVVHTK
ncbi:9912_t:CDS:10 [Acaulospora morrowiae]|uniref:9912_t:CDS:1 n=1 Tax=Acaulospora morrowiae TaxID=94023 RepID=A0A9N8VWX6_9GLOM|nr:9912_t:CDS:10 [Acaulospora morrowiae]